MRESSTSFVVVHCWVWENVIPIPLCFGKFQNPNIFRIQIEFSPTQIIEETKLDATLKGLHFYFILYFNNVCHYHQTYEQYF